MHIASGLSSRNLQPGTLCCVLRNWFVCIDMEKLAVTVSGSYTKPNGIAVARHSSPIDIAIERRTIVATSGTMYQLVDAPDLEMMRMKGMPEYLVSQFADGFPRNWKQLVEEYLGISSEVRRGRGDLALRGEEAARTPTNGYLHHDYRSGLSMSNRFQPIAEDSEALASISPISPPSSVSISGYSGTRQQMSPSVTAAGSQRGNRKSVYRSGMDIFATDRFSRTRPAQKSEAFEPEHQKQAVLAEVVETRAEALSPVAESQTRSSTEMAMETPLERTPMARADTDLQNQIAAISMETPTKKPAHSSSLSPELGVAQISSWKSSHTNSTIDDLEPFKLDDDFESSEPGQTSSEPRMANPNLKPSQATTTPTAKPTSKKTRKLSRKIIESSDEFLAAPEDTGEEPRKSKGVVRTASPAKQSQKKTPETPKPTTPKRKLVKQEPDKTPEAPASVTRSGRKVRKPQEWWANAQEHLGSTYKGSDIKYHWGKGDAIIIRDGKRYRLSDVVLDGDNAEPLSSSHKGNTDEALDDDEHGK
ncbi:hypothetical protein LPJ68_002565 [Coemansia sp. RSA 1086]|nr:hypothetical protein LPJ68_002565 [Coemansia sp. RSA 1086]